MGRRLVDATNACRILRTRRKEPGRRFRVLFFLTVDGLLDFLAVDFFALPAGFCEDDCACR
jgi:hypothetical protein